MEPALLLDSVPAGRWHLRFSDCGPVDAALDGAAAPIVIQASNEATEPVGGMAFEQCLVRDPVERQPLVYQDWAGGLPVRQLGGTLIVERAGQRREIPLREELLDQWLPTRQLKLISPWDDTGVRYRPLADPWDPARLAGPVRQRQTVRWLLPRCSRRPGRRCWYRTRTEARFRATVGRDQPHRGTPLGRNATGTDAGHYPPAAAGTGGVAPGSRVRVSSGKEGAPRQLRVEFNVWQAVGGFH